MNGVPLWCSPEALYSKFAMFVQNNFSENKSANCLPKGNGLKSTAIFHRISQQQKRFSRSLADYKRTKFIIAVDRRNARVCVAIRQKRRVDCNTKIYPER